MKNLTWDGLLHSNFSFAIVSRNMVKALARNGVDVSFFGWRDIQTEIKDEELAPLTRKMINRDVGVRVSSPDSWGNLNNLGCREKIGLLPWEINLVADDFVQMMNNKVHWCWAQSEYNKKAFVDSGVLKDKIKVIPYGVDRSLFDPQKGISQGFSDYYDAIFDDKYVFLHIGTMQQRKGSDLLVRAFIEEFGKDEDVALYLKNYDPCGEGWADNNLQSYDEDKHPLIYHEYQRFGVPEDQVYQYYRQADCLVHPCRAEGFGMTMLEAMSMGVPVIATKYGGHRDFVSEENSFLIEADFVPTTHWYGHDFDGRLKWHDPDIKHLRETMRYVFENRLSEDVVKKRVNGLSTADKFSWDNSAKMFIDHFLKD